MADSLFGYLVVSIVDGKAVLLDWQAHEKFADGSAQEYSRQKPVEVIGILTGTALTPIRIYLNGVVYDNRPT
jgi:hypothetical protein